MILYTPLDIPKIVPNDWEAWWKVWETRDFLVKTTPNHNYDELAHLNWKGVDLYQRPGAMPVYQSPQVEKSPVVDDLVQQVFDAYKVEIDSIRVIENQRKINFHSDNTFPSPQIRSVLWSTYKNPLWKLKYHNEERQMKLPESTNSFYFFDYPLEHEAEYEEDESKGLLVVYSRKFYQSHILNLAKQSSEKYKEYAWETQPTLLS
jgi:hypothetical protein